MEWVLLNMEANVEIDITATDMLEQLRAELTSAGTTLALVRVKQDLKVYLDRAGLVAASGPTTSSSPSRLPSTPSATGTTRRASEP